MKKIFFLFFLILYCSQKTFAACDYSYLCPQKPASSVSDISQFFSNVTGSTYIAEQFANNLIHQELQKATGQNFTVDLKAYTATELLDGKFKSLTLSANNVNIQGIQMSSLKAQTICDYNSIDFKSKPIKLRENTILSVSAEFSAEDLKKSIEYRNYSQIVSSLDLSVIGISAFRVYPNTISIEDGKLYFSINAKPLGHYKPLDISVGANWKVKDEKVLASRIDLINLYSGFNLTQLTNYLNPVNYLKFNFYITGTQMAEVRIEDLNIIKDRAYISAIILISKV